MDPCYPLVPDVQVVSAHMVVEPSSLYGVEEGHCGRALVGAQEYVEQDAASDGAGDVGLRRTIREVGQLQSPGAVPVKRWFEPLVRRCLCCADGTLGQRVHIVRGFLIVPLAFNVGPGSGRWGAAGLMTPNACSRCGLIVDGRWRPRELGVQPSATVLDISNRGRRCRLGMLLRGGGVVVLAENLRRRSSVQLTHNRVAAC